MTNEEIDALWNECWSNDETNTPRQVQIDFARALESRVLAERNKPEDQERSLEAKVTEGFDVSKLKHEDNCRWWQDETFCTCGADQAELCKRWKAHALYWKNVSGGYEKMWAEESNRLLIANACCERLMSACTDAGCPDGVRMDDWIRANVSVLAERKPSVGAHLWMPVEIAEPTKAPQDFGDRKSYAFKAPDAGEHDPWYVVLPNMHALKLGYHADDAIDRQHAEFIAAAINRALAHPTPDDAKDAARYRIIKNGLPDDELQDIAIVVAGDLGLSVSYMKSAESMLDAAIDRARQSGEESNGNG
ncbi:hypothetical protein [Caballeronia sp. INML2]|uniref:hypothetical protein n=1 Tax=Caballeronia sp. INML2 TaxID=2921748 RepID=UPI0020285BF1|nr:hypothetical protein [Caballeronia sp. INML2]